MSINVEGLPVSYSTANGSYSMVHVMTLYGHRITNKGPVRWIALPTGLCGARLLVKDGAISLANMPANSATCNRCRRMFEDLGVSQAVTGTDGVVSPGWRPRQAASGAEPRLPSGALK
jgi:hypothetical protein